MTHFPQKRLDLNLCAYARSVMQPYGVVVLGSSEMREPDTDTPYVLEVSTIADLSPMDMVNASVPVTFDLRGQAHANPDDVQALAYRLYAALWCDPQPHYRTIQANQALLDAVNFVPGATDNRPAQGMHLYDLMFSGQSSGPSQSAQNALVYSSVLAATAVFGPYDWDGAERYGQPS